MVDALTYQHYKKLRAKGLTAAKAFYAAKEPLTHSFWLRPDLLITFDLPPNFTKAEAERLATAVETFSF